MYHPRTARLVTDMDTLQRCTETAVRRDLERARVVLVDQRLSPERRCALTEHLMWVVALVDPAARTLGAVGSRVRRAAEAFGAEGDRPHRQELLCELMTFLRVSRTADGWASTEVRNLADHLPWLLDGLPITPGPGLHLPQVSDPLLARERARSYRRQRVLLWGTVLLRDHAPRVLV